MRLAKQVDQDDAAEVGGRRLELNGDAEEHALGQLVVAPPAAGQLVAFPLVLGERPGRVRDLEGPLSSLRTQAACRLHAVLCEITPGGVPKNITASRAAAILGAHHPDGPIQQ
jgi:hypothetical protein